METKDDSKTVRALTASVLVAAALAACTPGGEGAAPADAAAASTPTVVEGGASSEAGATTADRGPTTLDVAGDPNGLVWDASSESLLVADDDGNRLLRWRATGFEALAELPPAPAAGPGLGQPVVLPDGRIVVPRFGHGTAGDVVVVEPGGASRVVQGLDPQRRRIGLARAPGGRLFVSFFTGERGQRIGSVAELDLERGEERVVATGFRKPVGVLADEASLLVADQDVGEIVRVPLDRPEARERIVALAGPDLLAAGPRGGFFAGTKAGGVVFVEASGAVATLPVTVREVRGVAWDAANRRVFVVDHDTAATSARHAIHLAPFE